MLYKYSTFAAPVYFSTITAQLQHISAQLQHIVRIIIIIIIIISYKAGTKVRTSKGSPNQKVSDSNECLLNWWDHSLFGIRVCHWTISIQYQILPKYSPIFRILMTNNSKTKAKITTPNITIPIPIELLQFLLKKGQYIVPNNIVDK